MKYQCLWKKAEKEKDRDRDPHSLNKKLKEFIETGLKQKPSK